MLKDPKSAKKDSHVKQLFALLGFSSVKAVCKHVDEIDPFNSTQQIRQNPIKRQNKYFYKTLRVKKNLQSCLLMEVANVYGRREIERFLLTSRGRYRSTHFTTNGSD